MNSSDSTSNTRSSLLSRVVSGTAWHALELLLVNVFSFVVKLILARLLVPEYFGLVGMAVVFTGLVTHVKAWGFRKALVQRPDDELTKQDWATGRLGAIFVGIALYFLVVLPGAPLVAWFFDEPQLIPIVLILATPVLFVPFTIGQRALLYRELKFRHLAKLKVAAALAGGITAIGLALGGAGVWAIVAQWVVTPAVTTSLLWLTVRSAPEGHFSRESFVRLFRYGSYIVGSRACKFLMKRADYLFVGKMVGAASLGAYTLAFLLTDAIRSKVMAVLDKVLFPSFSQIQQDKKRVNEYYLGSLRFNTVLVFPVVCALIVYAEPVVMMVFGDEWHEAVLPLQLLAVAAGIHTIGGSTSSVLRALNYPNLDFKIQLVQSVFVLVPAMVVGLHFFGLPGAAAAVVINKLVARMWFQFYMRRIVGTRELQIARAVGPACLGFVVMGLALAGLHTFVGIDGLIELFAFLVAAGLCYLAAVLPLIKRDIQRLLRRD